MKNLVRNALKAFVVIGIGMLSAQCSSDDEDNAEMLLLAGLFASGSCTQLPATWVIGTPAFDCTASGLVYTCVHRTGAVSDVIYKFSSAAAAGLGVLDAPVVAPGFLAPGFRGTEIQLSGTVTSTYTLDAQNRLSGISNTLGQNYNFSNYDSNGFPQNITGTVTAAITNTYDPGATRPSQIAFGTSTLNYVNGIMSNWNVNGGMSTGAATTVGTVSVCD